MRCVVVPDVHELLTKARTNEIRSSLKSECYCGVHSKHITVIMANKAFICVNALLFLFFLIPLGVTVGQAQLSSRG